MLKGLGDLGNLMKLQKDVKNIQKKITGISMEATSPDGSVRAVVNGEFRLVSIAIDPESAKNAGKGDLEKSIMSAVNGAVDRIKEFSKSEMEKLTGGLDIPGLGNFFK